MKTTTTNSPRWLPGDGATICRYADRTACTVVRVAFSGHTLFLRPDRARLEDWAPEFVANHAQRYVYEADPEAPVYKATRRKDGRFRTVIGGELIIPGRHQFHDYNV